MKKTIFTLMTALIVSASAIAQTPIENSNLTWELSDGTLTIAGTGDMPNYSWNGAPWYNSGREDITEIVIEEGVKSIGGYAFGDCINLTSVEIPGSVVSIEESAFVCCSKLTSIEIHEGVENIGDWAFSGCENLTEIDVAAGNSHYASADGILYNKDKTILIQCPEGKTVVDNIPASVTSIGNEAFYGCSNLTSIEIPGSVVSIGDGAFYDCSNLTSLTILNLDPATITMYDVFDGVYGCNLIVPAGAKDDYEEIWAEYFDAGVFLTDIGEYAPTGITDLRAAPAAVVGYYSIMGQKLPQAPERGLYITVYSDGRSEKVIKN